MALSKTGYGENSAESFVIDAAVVFKNLKYDPETKEWSGDLLGATNGGTEVNIEKKYRKIETDGSYMMDVMGLNAVESTQATFKTNLKELTADNMALAMGGKIRETNEYGENIVIEDRYTVEKGDYIGNMGVVGTLTGTNEPVIFIFDNVLITSPFNIKTEDNNEASVELTGQANGTYEQLQKRESPYRIIYPKRKGAEATESPVATPKG